MFASAFSIVLILGLQATPAPRHYTSSKQCGFEFDYPASWVVLPAAGTETCSIQLRPADFAAQMKELDVDLYTLEVGRVYGSFLRAADDSFDFVDGKWATKGRAPTPASVVLTERWSGLRGTAATGCFHQGGVYAGLCDVEVLLLSDRDTGYMWSMTGKPQSYAVFDMILASFRFTKG